MADNKTAVTTVVPAGSTASSFFKRELSGATFLSLEHAGHMALVVVTAMLLSVGIVTAISLWTGNSGVLSAFGTMPTVGGSAARYTDANAAIGIIAALIVLVPALAVLDRRTRAELAKRPAYAGRVAYKLPIYLALAALVVAKIAAVIQMLTVVLTSLAVLGVNGSGVGEMYLYQFLPAAIAAVIFGTAEWYLFKLAKGRDNGRVFGALVAGVGMVLAIALFVTAVITLRTPSTTSEPTEGNTRYFDDWNSDDTRLEDLFNY
jgi:hypothetical protein